MAYIYVNKAKFRTFGDTTKQIGNRIKRINNELSSTGRCLDWDIKSESHINETISQISNDLDRYTRILNKMSNFLALCNNEYNKLDKESFRQVTKVVDPVVVSPKNKNMVSDILSWFGKELSSLKEMPIAGNLLNFIGKSMIAISGPTFDYAGRSILGNISSIVLDGERALGDIYNIDNILNEKAAKKLIGVSLSPKKIPLASWSDRFTVSFKNKFDDFFKGFTKRGAQTAFAVADMALSFGSNYIENFYEEDISKTRAWKETITETVIDTGKGLLIGAVVAGGVAVVGLTGSAAIGATLLASTFINGQIDLVSGGDSTEAISDGILDGYDWVTDKISEAVNRGRNPVGIPEAAWSI